MIENSSSYYLMRRVFAFGLGIIYLNAFLIYFNQGLGLYGHEGLLPYDRLIPGIVDSSHSIFSNFWQVFSVFVFDYSDFTIQLVAILGLILSLFLILGWVNFPILFILWLLHISVIHVGQIFYSYGWETQLLELTFLSFFLFPFLNPKLDRPQSPPKMISIWFMRWMMFRLMLGAGLIKLRGDQCWLDLTCTNFHYETQPNPNPLSWLLHHAPEWFHKLEVLGNHSVELIIPFLLFGSKNIRRFCGVILIGFQLSLIASGNLAWLNWLTILMAIPCFDDQFLSRFLVFKRLKKYLTIKSLPFSNKTYVVLFSFFIVGVVLSVHPALNLISDHQKMNSSYNRFHLINSYGAFGSIGKVRSEIIISGTNDEVVNDRTVWKEYEFKCKPGRLDRRPCLISPYHYRLDWQIWFSAMRPKLSEVWLLRLGIGFLQDNRVILGLVDTNPFKGVPPKFIKMDLFQYEYSGFGDKNWWSRKFLVNYMSPLSLESPIVTKYK